jgi:hypothetical protein
VNGFFSVVNVATLHVHVLGGVNVPSVNVLVYATEATLTILTHGQEKEAALAPANTWT